MNLDLTALFKYSNFESETNSFSGFILKFGTQMQQLLGYPQALKKWHNLYIDFTQVRVSWKVTISLLND